MVFNLAQELIDEDYHRSDTVRARQVDLIVMVMIVKVMTDKSEDKKSRGVDGGC